MAADVELIKSKNRAYIRSKSDKGRQFIMEHFHVSAIGVYMEMVNMGFSVDNFEEIEAYLKKHNIEIEY